MSPTNSIRVLLLAIAACGPVAAENEAQAPEPACGQAQAYQRYHRPTHFSIKRNSKGFEYKCTLRKNKYRKKDPAIFSQECEAFVNEYIGILNRCEDANLARFMLNQSERRESAKSLKYTGFIPIS